MPDAQACHDVNTVDACHEQRQHLGQGKNQQSRHETS